MKPGQNCWNCEHLTSRVHAVPPVLCKAYPDGVGVPFEILGGIVRHDRLLGNEKHPVFYQPKGEKP